MDETTTYNAEEILGGDDFASEDGQAQTISAETPETAAATEQAQPVTPAQPTEPSLPAGLDQSEIGKAFAAQRQAMAEKHAAELELARQQAMQQAWAQMQQAQQQEQAMPDPVSEPEAFAAYLQQRDQQVQQHYAQQMQQQMRAVQTQTSLEMARMQADMAKATTGFGWDEAVAKANAEIARLAPLMGTTPEQYVQYVSGAPNAGQLIMQLAQANHERTAGASAVDLEKVKQEAYQKALADFQAKALASPHNLAVPGVGGIPSVTVTQPRGMTREEILGQ